MAGNYDEFIANLNNENMETRLQNLRYLADEINGGKISRPIQGNDVNNHIHTWYSFSPYSPSKAVWMAYMAGLKTAGIMDHDSISGACEFIEAGKIIGISTTIGVECRADFSGTPLNGRRINNPDQSSVAYMALHGIPHTQIDKVKSYFLPYMKERNMRNRKMTCKLNEIFEPAGISIDFDMDVIPLSRFSEGGSITERHLLFALAGKLIDVFGKGQKLVTFLQQTFKLNIAPKAETRLLDESNELYPYDLLGVLKGELVSRFYIDASAECPDVKEVIKFAAKIGAISAYAYLGDVGVSVTGDKKAQKFEDDYIEELFEVIKGLSFNAVTYMPSRNTAEQLRNIKSLCDRHGLFQISGEDINSPGQPFICEAARNEEFSNLIDATWALIGHEMIATEDLNRGMFSAETVEKYPDINVRTQIYKALGQLKRNEDVLYTKR